MMPRASREDTLRDSTHVGPRRSRARGGATALVLMAALALAAPAAAGEMALAWDPVPDADVTGYRIYVGSSPGLGDQAVVDVGRVDSVVLTGLPDCSDLYVGVKAVDAGGQLSTGFSGFVQGLPRPYVTGATPSRLTQGQEDVTLRVQGGNFTSGMQRTDLVFDDPDLRVLDLSVISCDELELRVSVGPFLSQPGDPGYSGAGGAVEEVHPAEIGARSVAVTAPDDLGTPILGASPDALEIDFLTQRTDIDGNGRVDGFDLARMMRAFGDSGSYDLGADLDGDDAVDGLDQSILAELFGTTFF